MLPKEFLERIEINTENYSRGGLTSAIRSHRYLHYKEGAIAEAERAQELADVLMLILNSDMAMREEDEINLSPILNSVRGALTRYREGEKK